MRILIVSQWFEPEPTLKGLAFAKALRDLGHEVSVLTGFPNYPGGMIYPGHKLRLIKREKIEGIDVTRVFLFPSHSGSAVGRILNYVSFAISSAFCALFLPRPDVVYSYHPPGTAVLAAMLLKAFRRVPFVVDIQDMWPDTLRATGMGQGGIVVSVAGKLMNAIYRRAAKIVVLSPGFKRLLAERGVPEEKITVIPNWTFEDAIDGHPNRHPEGGKFTVLYSGNIGAAQSLGVVLDAAEQLGPGSNIVFEIMGSGIELTDLKRAAEQRELTNVQFLGRRSAADAADYARRADALLIHLRDDPLFEVTIPSKTQSALLAGRPILIGVRGDAAHMVEQAGSGFSFAPENSAALVASIRHLRGMPRDERDAMGAAGRTYYLNNLSLHAGSRAFAEVFAQVQRSGG